MKVEWKFLPERPEDGEDIMATIINASGNHMLLTGFLNLNKGENGLWELEGSFYSDKDIIAWACLPEPYRP